jgi:hypothetical protein
VFVNTGISSASPYDANVIGLSLFPFKLDKESLPSKVSPFLNKTLSPAFKSNPLIALNVLNGVEIDNPLLLSFPSSLT